MCMVSYPIDLCVQVREERIGDVVRMKMSPRRGSWCLKRMDKVHNEKPSQNLMQDRYLKHISPLNLLFVFSPRICSSH